MWSLAALATLILLVAIVTVVLRTRFNGPQLAETLEEILNRKIRGRVEIESVEWPMASLPRVATGGWIPITIRGVRVYDDGGMQGEEVDDDKRELLLETDLITGYVDAHALIFGHPDFIIRDMKIPEGGYLLVREVAEPYPLHEYDRTVVSISSAFYSRLRLGFRAGIMASSAAIFDIRDLEFRGITLEVAYPDVHFLAENVDLTGFLHYDHSDPLKDKLYFAVTPTAERGIICLGDIDPLAAKAVRTLAAAEAQGGLCVNDRKSASDTIYEIAMEDIRIPRLAQIPTDWPRDTIAHDVVFDIHARTRAGSDMHLEGGLLQYWVGYLGGDYDFEFVADDAGEILQLITEEYADGADVKLRARVTGPSIGPKVELFVDNFDIHIPMIEDEDYLDLHVDTARAAFDMVTEQGSLEDAVARGGGGEAVLSASFALDPFQFDLRADIRKSILIGPYLPEEIRNIAGSRLRGQLRAVGDSSRQRMDTLDLWLGRAHVTGDLVADEFETLHAKRLRFRLGETDVVSSGVVDVTKETFDLGVVIESQDLKPCLAGVGAPTVARELTGSAHISGTFDSPRARADLTFGGIDLIREARVQLGYENRIVSVHEATSYGLGGRLFAQGRFRVGNGTRVLNFQADAQKLDLSLVPMFGGLVAGRLSARASAKGRVDRLGVAVDGGVDDLTIAGDAYELEDGVQLRMNGDGSKKLAFSVARVGGGTLETDANVDKEGNLSGEIALVELPLDNFGVLGGADGSPVGGRVSTMLALSGTPGAPTASGRVDWLGGWLQDAFLGAASFDVKPLGPGQVGIEGSLLGGDLQLSAVLHTAAPYYSEVRLQLRRVELDRFLPELSKEYQVRGWVSGTVDARIPLTGEEGAAPSITAELSEIEVLREMEDSRGRPAPIRIHNKSSTPISLHFDGTVMKLNQAVTLVGPGGVEFVLSGRGQLDELDLKAVGYLPTAVFLPYMREYFDQMSGRLAVEVAVTGPVDDPDIVVSTEILEPVAARPTGQDSIVSVAKGGLVKVTNEQIAPTAFRVIVEDPYTGEKATLKIGGGVRLEDFRPASLGLQIDGELAGKLLLVVLPEVFSRASGSAEVSLAIRGEPGSPKPYGEIFFHGERPLALAPRGLRREIRITAGEISFLGDDIELAGIAGFIDDEGRVRELRGDITMENLEPVSLALSMSADSLPFHIPQTLDLNLNIDDLRIVGNVDEGLDIGAVIEVTDGRYIRDFNLITDVITPKRSTDSSAPFYEDIPLLADARLDLTIDTRGFFVQNNIANIQLIGEVELTGTPREPLLNGEVRVEQGTFKLPGVRAKFTRTRGSVSFSEFKKFPRDTPTLDVQSESDYRDPSGQEHLVTLTLKGPLSALNWNLYTSSGLNKGQTIALIVSGRTPEELRKTLGDDAKGIDTGRVETSTNPNESLTDELLKDLAGDFISLYIEDKLRNLTTLDVARLEIGTGSIGFHGEKEVFKNLRFLGDLEQTLRGRTVDVRGQYRLSDKLSVESEYLNKNFDDDSEEDVSDIRLRAVWRYFLP